MRIIAGSARGRRLKCPHGLETRPTPDRVREAIFNILADRVAQSRVLDLFAGTGAMGLEALSRGARRAVFVENNPKTLRVLEENIRECRCGEKADVVPLAVGSYLGRGFSPGGFDLIFADPPYKGEEGTLTLMALSKHAKSLPECLVILEHAPGDNLAQPPGLRIIETRKYGNTAVTFFRFASRETLP